MKTLYHGSDKNIKAIDLSKCLPYTDFGKGFYLTFEFKNAKEWARNRNPLKYYVTKYEVSDDFVDEALRAGLNVKFFAEADPEWAKFIYDNRHDINYNHGYDIVVGPVADNNLQAKFIVMERKNLSFDDIASQIDYKKFKKPQVCFCTQESLKLLKKIKTDGYTN